jgi:Mg2+/Co2+ transporter CorB
MSPLFTLILVAVLLTFSAILCATEIAMISASKAQLHQAARKGDKRALKALGLLKHPDQLLATILIVMTLVPVASSALTTILLVDLLGPVGVAYGTIALAVIILLVAEALPKAIGTRYPEAITLAMVGPMAALMRFLSPLTWAVKQFNTAMLFLMGLRHKKRAAFTEADLRGAINLGLEHGTLGKIQHRMLDSVLDLDELTVADVMIHRSAIVSLNINTPAKDLPQRLGELKHSRVLVYEEQKENLIGILYMRDYLAALAATTSRDKVQLRQHLRPLYFVPETTPLGHQLLEFLRLHRHLAMVVDEYGDLQGLITLEDILEEIVGDIADEHDTHHADQRASDGSVTLSGNTKVREANRHYNWELPDDSAVTLAGLMVEHLGHLPSQGEAARIGPLTLTVASKRGHRVEKIRIFPHADE